MSLQYDSEFAKVVEASIDSSAPTPKLPPYDVQGRRIAGDKLYESIKSRIPEPPDVQHSTHDVTSFDGQTITVHRFFKPQTSSSPTPAILHCHGGGMIRGSVGQFQRSLMQEVDQSGVQILSVDYRLAPEHPDPIPVRDCYAGLAWLHSHAADFNIDPTRIATMGESAGGGLAAGITLMARDRRGPPVAKQILIYPMLDDRKTVVNPAIEPLAVWKCDDNITGWSALLGDRIGTEHVSPYAAPARMQSLDRVPHTYMEVGGLDYFRDETLAYAAKIAAANISIELHLWDGVPHMFEAIAPDIRISKMAIANRIQAMTSF